MSRADFQDLYALHALGALDPAEAEALEAHLRSCRGCCDYLRALSPAVDALAAEFGQPREVIAGELVGLCRTLEERGLVKRDDA